MFRCLSGTGNQSLSQNLGGIGGWPLTKAGVKPGREAMVPGIGDIWRLTVVPTMKSILLTCPICIDIDESMFKK